MFSTQLVLTWTLINWRFLSPPGVMRLVLRILRFWKNTNPAGPWENVPSQHPISMSSPYTKNSSESRIPLGVQVNWRVQWFPMSAHMVRSKFFTTLACMIPKLNYWINRNTPNSGVVSNKPHSLKSHWNNMTDHLYWDEKSVHGKEIL